MSRKPIYNNIFEYMKENYSFKPPSTPITRFYKWDISENQYANLDGPVNPEKMEFKDPQEASEVVKEFSIATGADIVGFTKVKDSFVFSGIDIPHKFAVVLGKEMDLEIINTSPEPPSGIEVLRIYWRLGDIANKVALFMRKLGYSSRAHHPRSYVGKPPTILHTAAAYEAGLGEVGRNGLLITPEFGPRVRVVTITTDLELPPSSKKEFGVVKYCKNCTLCRDHCEGDAIFNEMQEIDGVKRYVIDPYKCLPYFAKFDGCNLCVSKCAFNKDPEKLRIFLEKIKS